MTADNTLLAASFALGAFAGTLYFGGLWLTVRNIAAARQPRMRLALSFILRMGVLLAIFYRIPPLGALAIVAAFAGLLIIRQLWLLGKRPTQPTRG